MQTTDGGYTLGIDLGTTFTAAAVDAGGRTQVVTLGHRSTVVPSVVYLAPDGTTVLGAAAERRGAQDPERLARQVKRRVGDSVPLMLGGVAVTAEGLMAELLAWVVAQVVEQRGGPPDAVAVTHPANWGAFKRERLADILRLSGVEGLAPLTTLTEPEAAALSYAAAERVPPGEVVAVYDLGGGTFDASVLRKDATGFEVLGTPSGIEHLGGVDLDEAVMAHVVRSLGIAVDELPDDERTRRAVARLRAECIDAKEALSADSEATVAVTLPGVTGDVRITRAELESMVRPLVEQSATALRHTVASAGLAAADIDRVLLVGGSSRVPLVGEVVAEALARPVALDAHPKHATALGAALAARSGLDARRAAGATPPVPPAPPVLLPPAAPVLPPPAPPVASGPPLAPVTGLTPQGPPAPGAPAPVPLGSPPPGPPAGSSGPYPPAPIPTPTVVKGPDRNRPALVAAIVAAVLVAATVAALAARSAGDDTPGSTGSTARPAASATTAAPTTGTTAPTTTTTTTTAPTTTTTTLPDPEDLAVAGVTATAAAADGFDACNAPTSFAPANVTDGLRETAWRVDGDGTGQSLTVDLGVEQRVLVVGLVPGYDKVDACDGVDRWAQNRRPTQVTWRFADGTASTQTLEDTRELQTLAVDVDSDTVTLEIDGVTPSPGRDFTAVSEVVVQGA